MSAVIDGISVEGHFSERFSATASQFAKNFSSGADLGASFAMSVDGEMVVDIWAGHKDEARRELWQEDTIVNVWSSTKTVSFLCALVLADRGLLDFDAPVARYWPEFAENGKNDVLVWHIMSHAAGLSGMSEAVTATDFCDWEKMTRLLAAQASWWPPGTASGYHAMTQGYLIGEVVRRITGKTMGQFLQEEIAGPLQADFFIGVPESEFPRIGNLQVPPGTNDMTTDDADSIAARTFANPKPRAEDAWTDAWRRAEMPAVNGHGNARSLVRLQTALACGGCAFGVELMREETTRLIMQERISGDDLVLGMPVMFGLGFALNRGPVTMSPNPNTCFWGGWGGSMVLIDQDARVVMSYVMNQMYPSLLGDLRFFQLGAQAFQDLG